MPIFRSYASASFCAFWDVSSGCYALRPHGPAVSRPPHAQCTTLALSLRPCRTSALSPMSCAVVIQRDGSSAASRV